MRILVPILLCLAGAASAASNGSLTQGELSIVLDMHRLHGLGFTSRTQPVVHLQSRAGGAIDVELAQGRLAKLDSGIMRFGGGPDLGHRLNLSSVFLRVHADNEFIVQSADGLDILALRMGHLSYSEGSSVEGHYFDVRIASGLASELDKPEISDVWVGSATIGFDQFDMMPASASDKGQPALCTDPVWPGENGAEADLEMIDIPDVDVFSANEPGRFRVAPSAIFKNVGTADIPWLQVFASPENDIYCLDDGTGACQPYGNDQQGLLIWNLYQLKDGVLRQVGGSGVKHAFNSINRNCTSLPQCSGSARIAWRSCEDEYSTSTNIRNDFLGLRGEIRARDVDITRCGSVFDFDCDDRCDNPSDGFVRCLANPPPDETPDERQLTIPDYMLSDPSARYFIETWYLVRDDINIRNSMGHIEIVFTPVGVGLWDAQNASGFIGGPLLGNPLFADSTVDISSEFGEGLFYSAVEPAGDNRFRYSYAVMNFTVDKGFDLFQIPFQTAGIDKIAFRDSTASTSDDWQVSWEPEVLTWLAPQGAQLPWGRMLAFSFETALPPSQGDIFLRVADKPSPDGIRIIQGRPSPAADMVTATGFEGELISTPAFITVD